MRTSIATSIAPAVRAEFGALPWNSRSKPATGQLHGEFAFVLLVAGMPVVVGLSSGARGAPESPAIAFTDAHAIAPKRATTTPAEPRIAKALGTAHVHVSLLHQRTLSHLRSYGPCSRTHSAGTGRMRELKREGCGVTLLLVQRGEAVVIR